MEKKPKIISASSGLEEAAAVFRASGIIAYPTETFYGLCVNPFDKAAIKKLFELKARPPESPISVIIKDRAMLGSVVEDIPEAAKPLMARFWPGPLTIIFKAKEDVPPELTGRTGKIGVRVSSNETAKRLSTVVNSPITATSANPTGENPPVTPQEVLDYFNGSIDMLIDGGRLAGKKGSTVIDVTGPGTVIIREGEIPSREISG